MIGVRMTIVGIVTMIDIVVVLVGGWEYSGNKSDEIV